jgi:hypothetical protein
LAAACCGVPVGRNQRSREHGRRNDDGGWKLHRFPLVVIYSLYNRAVARASKVERQARALCVELARVTGGRPMHWRTVGPIGGAVGLDDASAAVAYAAGQDWLLTEGRPPHSICLTEGGRVMVAKMKSK